MVSEEVAQALTASRDQEGPSGGVERAGLWQLGGPSLDPLCTRALFPVAQSRSGSLASPHCWSISHIPVSPQRDAKFIQEVDKSVAI